ncbi:MAG: hypothetical protein EP330_22480 [Deltaproteobacteria bacterium]|nr:MAG: hypothetical protein EP330_22480 [Deltaproteobacteria bacterium]
MQLLTWNLFGLETDELDARTEAAVFTALLGGPPEQVFASGAPPPAPPEILCFQEVVDRSLFAHLRPHVEAAGYRWVTSSRDQREYYELVAVREPLTLVEHHVHPLPTRQGRELLDVLVDGPDGPLRILTGHLESLASGAALRREQVDVVMARLGGGPALFAGDTNLREREVDGLPAEDAWVACGEPADARWTWHHGEGRAKARYDRIWGIGVAFDEVSTLGAQALFPGGPRPSDHLGLAARFTRR